jgi:hypothetical protein
MRFSVGCLAFLFIPFVGFGFILSEDALSTAFSAKRLQKRLVPVPARILSKSSERIQAHRATEFYRPSVNYEFTIGGLKQESDHLHLIWSEWFSHEESAEWIMPYIPDQSVTAWVNPAQPSEAVLLPELRMPWTGVLSGIGISTMGLIFMFLTALSIREEPRLNMPSEEPELRPQFARELLFPLVYGILWNVVSATGIAALLLSSRRPPAILVSLVLHAMIGIALAAWLARRIRVRRLFRGWRLLVEPQPVPKGTQVRWLLRTRGRHSTPSFHLLYREHEIDAARHHSEFWKYHERRVRAISADRAPEGWRGSLLVNRDEPHSVLQPGQQGHWVLRVSVGRDTAFFALAVGPAP